MLPSPAVLPHPMIAGDWGGLSMACDMLAELCRSIASTSSMDTFHEVVAGLPMRLGFASCAYYKLSILGEFATPKVIFGADPSPWTETYISRDYLSIDPLTPLLFRSDLPFTMMEAERQHSSPSSLHSERLLYWSKDALFCPVFSSYGEVGVVVWKSEEELAPDPEDRLALAAISSALVVKFKYLSGRNILPDLPLRPLSRRERECCYWLSRGKSGPEVAKILNLSTHTVRQYLDSAVQKLGAANRGEMLLRAATLGLITRHA